MHYIRDSVVGLKVTMLVFRIRTPLKKLIPTLQKQPILTSNSLWATSFGRDACV